MRARGDAEPSYVPSRIIDPDAPARGIKPTTLTSISTELAPKMKGSQKRSIGELFASGKANVSPETFLGSLGRNVKVRDQLDLFQKGVGEKAIGDAAGFRFNQKFYTARRLDKPEHKASQINADSAHAAEKTRALQDAGVDTAPYKQVSQHLREGWDHLTPDADGLSTVPSEGDWILVPNSSLKEMDGRLAMMDSRLEKLLNTTRAWRWITLNARPAWLVANIVGNTGMGVFGGAGPVDIARAMKGKYKEHTPDTVEGTGIFGQIFAPDTGGNPRMMNSLLGEAQPLSLGIRQAVSQGARGAVEDALAPGLSPKTAVTGARGVARAPFQAIRFAGNLAAELNVRHENLMRRALYLSQAVPAAKREVYKKTIATHKRVNDDVMATLAKYKTMEEAAPVLAQTVYDYLGHLPKPGAKGQAVAIVAPFWRWAAFISKHTLVNLPAKHPLKAVLLQRMGDLGMLGSEQMGLLPDYLQGSIPVGDDGENTLLMGTQAINPWASPFQMTGGGRMDFRGTVGQLSPFLDVPLTVATGRDITGRVMRNAVGEEVVGQGGYGIPSSDPRDRFRLFGNQAAGMLPFVGALAGRSGRADTNVPWIDEQLRIKKSDAPEQPQQSGGQRAGAYFGANIRPFNLDLNQRKMLLAERKRLIAQARNRIRQELARG
jgi:hypothetical protein